MDGKALFIPVMPCDLIPDLLMFSPDIGFKLILRSMPEIAVLRSNIGNVLYILCGKLHVMELLPVLF